MEVFGYIVQLEEIYPLSQCPHKNAFLAHLNEKH